MSDNPSNLEEAILDLADWSRHQRKVSKRALWIVLPISVIGIAIVSFAAWSDWQSKKKTEAVTPTWFQVYKATDRGELSQALEYSESLVEKNPSDFEGLFKMGKIHLKMGHDSDALECFKKAYEIFPQSCYMEAIEALETKLKS